MIWALICKSDILVSLCLMYSVGPADLLYDCIYDIIILHFKLHAAAWVLLTYKRQSQGSICSNRKSYHLWCVSILNPAINHTAGLTTIFLD